MDLFSQFVAEYLLMLFWLIIAIIGAAHGYLADAQKYSWYWGAFGAAASTLVFVPDWPFWNKRGITWSGERVVKKKSQKKAKA